MCYDTPHSEVESIKESIPILFITVDITSLIIYLVADANNFVNLRLCCLLPVAFIFNERTTFKCCVSFVKCFCKSLVVYFGFQLH